MEKMTEKQRAKKTMKLLDQVGDIVDGCDFAMIEEIFGTIMADMIKPVEPEVGIPLMVMFVKHTITSAYGLEAVVITDAEDFGTVQ
jgi:hypothetical protein